MTRYQRSPHLSRLIALAAERAVKGAELVVGGGVAPLTASTYIVKGSTMYLVDLETGTCTCPDSKAPVIEGAKLCKHTCAVMLYKSA